MLRTTLSLTLVVSSLLSSPPSLHLHAAENTAQADQALTQYRNQSAIALQTLQSAELQLQSNLQQLQKLPDSPQRSEAMTSLQKLLAQVQQLHQNAVSPPSPTAIDVHDTAARSNEVNRLTNLAQLAQTDAAQGAQITNQTIAELTPRPQSAAPMPREQQPTHPYVPPVGGASPPPPPKHAAPHITHSATVAPKSETTPAPPAASPHVSADTPATQATPAQPAVAQPETDPAAIWFAKLGHGLLQYSVPPLMQWKVSSPVTVQIAGETAPTPAPLDQQNGQATVAVSRQMKVMVTAPDNPDEFIITPDPDTQLQQYVPENGSTTWNFSVTPRYTTSSAKIVVRAWVVYDANTLRELPVYQKVVAVQVPSLGECLKRLIEGDPDYWLKYGLPGGSGFIFLSGLIGGIWKWRANRKNPKS